MSNNKNQYKTNIKNSKPKWLRSNKKGRKGLKKKSNIISRMMSAGTISSKTSKANSDSRIDRLLRKQGNIGKNLKTIGSQRKKKLKILGLNSLLLRRRTKRPSIILLCRTTSIIKKEAKQTIKPIVFKVKAFFDKARLNPLHKI